MTRCQRVCQGFKSPLVLCNATVAQLVEHLPEEQGVGGSTPSGGTVQQQTRFQMRVLNDNVMVQVEAVQTQTASGLYIPETAQEGQILYGKVVGVGKGKRISDAEGNRSRETLDVHIGDVVYFPKFNASKIERDGKTFYVMSEVQILFVE